MIPSLQPYIDSILQERSWSWAIVCILYLLAAAFVRSWFLAPIGTSLKTLDKKYAHKLKGTYLKMSAAGWLFFMIPLFLIMIFWMKDKILVPVEDYILVILGMASFILSIVLHLQAFAVAAITTLEHAESQKRDI